MVMFLMYFCPNCGEEIDKYDDYCANCGKKVDHEDVLKQDKLYNAFNENEFNTSISNPDLSGDSEFGENYEQVEPEEKKKTKLLILVLLINYLIIAFFSAVTFIIFLNQQLLAASLLMIVLMYLGLLVYSVQTYSNSSRLILLVMLVGVLVLAIFYAFILAVPVIIFEIWVLEFDPSTKRLFQKGENYKERN